MDASDLGLRRGDALLVDASPLIYFMEDSGARHRAVEAFLALAAEAELRLLASTIVWAELLRGPLASARPALADGYRRLLADSSRIVLSPVDVAVADEAARLMALRGLPLADALHVATARTLAVAAILGNDESWREVPECPPLLLVDELAFQLRSSA